MVTNDVQRVRRYVSKTVAIGRYEDDRPCEMCEYEYTSLYTVKRSDGVWVGLYLCSGCAAWVGDVVFERGGEFDS